MKILLIEPAWHKAIMKEHIQFPPLGLAMVAAATPPEHEIRLLDENLDALEIDDPVDLVGITAMTCQAMRAYEIAAEYRLRGVPVILGGMHVTLIPEEAAEHADSILLGDAETVWTNIVDDARKRKLQPRYEGKPGVGQINRVLPRRDLFKGKGYLPLTLMQYVRGCRFACSFCAVSQYFDKKHYHRAIDDVLREIEAQDRKFIFFIDDNIASDHKALAELCHALIPMKLHWVSQASLDVTRNLPLMKLLERAGNWGNVTGFESITPQSLRDARKSPNLPRFSHYKEEVRVLREHGMQSWAAFTLGYDHDTPESIAATVDFALESRFTLAAYNILMPYPNTPLYRQLEKEGRLLWNGKWWLHPQYRFNHAAFVPRLMTPEELTDACHAARTRFNSFPSLLHRFADVKTHLRSAARVAGFWKYTLLFKKEIPKKHGMRFGLH